MITMIWLLPILFMLHDFEEIIMVEAWKKRNKISKTGKENNGKDFLSTKTPYIDLRATASFSIGVAIEFFILSAASLASAISGNYYIWFAFMFGITFHYIIHLKMCVDFKGYVPGITTAIVCFPMGVGLLIYVACAAALNVLGLVISCCAGLLFVAAMVKILHELMGKFDEWLNRYAEK